MAKMAEKSSQFVIGRDVSVSEFAKYWGPILRYCQETGESVRITRRDRATHVLSPIPEKE